LRIRIKFGSLPIKTIKEITPRREFNIIAVPKQYNFQ
jgi:hypothetical protein